MDLTRAAKLQIIVIAIAQALAMGLWFAASAVAPQLSREWGLTEAAQSWLTISIQLGFVAGALISAALNLADRYPAQYLSAAAAALAALVNALIPYLDIEITGLILSRALVGACLACVYPPGMKLVASWSIKRRGLVIGILVGALTAGTALPHLINALPLFSDSAGLGMPPWRETLVVSSALAALGAFLLYRFTGPGPHLSESAPFNWRVIPRVFAHRPTLLANFGYLGHMWELYAVWTWAPLFLLTVYSDHGWSAQAARVAGFVTVAIGALGCIWAGKLADALGRERVTIWSMLISGACCLCAGFLTQSPALLTALCLIWGFAVVADSAQFSALVSELFDQRYVGSALTLQTSLGFLLTAVTIRVVPIVVEHVGWSYAFIFLAPGPLFGIFSMWRLSRLRRAASNT
ncbi:MAG TPA: MFS transporter [candidate division Zixibacteria bacterium]|nr:MFS transporter [candidate division Zixibacteria bacterium]